MGIKSNLLIQATKYNSKGITKLVLGLFNKLDRLFSPAGKKESFHNKRDNQHLNDALVVAVENLNYNMVELLVNAGADVNSLDKNNKNAITHAVDKLATSKGLSVDPSKNLPEEIISHPVVQFLLVRGSEYYTTDNMDIEGKHTTSIKGNVVDSLQPEPIYEEIPAKEQLVEPTYAEVDGFEDDLSSGYSSIKELRSQRKSIDLPHIYAAVDLAAKQGVQEQDDKHIYEEIDHFRDDKHIYEEIDHFRRDNNSFDSGYSSIEEQQCAEASDERARKNPLYVSAEECKTQEESIDSSKQEPTYAKVDLHAKRMERKTKSTKADSGTHSGLVKDKISQWQERMKQNEQNSQQQKKVETRAGFSVKERTQKYENENLGYNSGYESDTKQSRIKPKTPSSKVDSVHVEWNNRGVSI